VPPYWLPYFAVDDCDTTVARAGSLGGSTCAGPMDIPNVGRFAVLGDPQGGTFAVIRLTM
jgi:predicted enzyme related to lactoylglutathione lyase